MTTTRTLAARLSTAIATVAVGAAAGATTYVLIPPASAGVEATARTSASEAARTSTDEDTDSGGPGCGPFGGWGSGEVPDWLQDRLDDLPADLRADLEAAWRIDDRAERRDALREIWQAARDGEYGAEVREHVEDRPFGGSWGPGRGGGWGPGGHRGPWGR